jgi:adenylate cyclase, class 2
MPLNLELKVKVNSHSKFISILKAANAENRGILKQKDVYFKIKKGILKLRVENKIFTLIKYFREEKGKRWSNYELLKLEGANPEKYLKQIFEVEVVVEKKRKVWLYNNTRIHLDEVRGLGKYLELETLFTSTRSDAVKRFNDTVALLNLDLSGQIRASYKNLLMKK